VNEQLQAIVTVISLVNPMICATMFQQATSGQAFSEQLTQAAKATLTVMAILTIAALVGIRALHLFGVSLDAFMVAGGGVLAWMGFSMLSRASHDKPATSDRSLTPLILFAASPGTITGIITISAAHTRLDLPLTSLVAILVAGGVTFSIMVLVVRLAGRKHGGFLSDTTTRFMGLIVLSMGVQFALTGYHAFMHAGRVAS